MLFIAAVGIFFVLPCIDTYTKVDLRTVSFDVPPQEVFFALFYFCFLCLFVQLYPVPFSSLFLLLLFPVIGDIPASAVYITGSRYLSRDRKKQVEAV